MKRQYVITERAHYMCPNMHFGILCSINADYNLNKINETVQTLVEAHPFLSSLIALDEQERPYYSPQNDIHIKIIEREAIDTLGEDYQGLAVNGWDVHSEAMLKVLTYPNKAGKASFSILFVAHHLLCDGRGLLGLVTEFADYYVNGLRPAFAAEQLITSLLDLPKGSDLPWISKMVIDSANRQWKKEAQKVDYQEYLQFEKKYAAENKPTISFATKTSEELQEIIKLCHDNSISVNDYLIAEMMVEKSTNQVVIAADIRNHLANYVSGSLGNYSTAFTIVCRSKSDDIVETAKIVSGIVRKKLSTPREMMLVLACYLRMAPELLDAVAISTLGEYESKAANFVGSRMFGFRDRDRYSITNLGRIESDTIQEAVLIPPASPATRMMVGVLTVNDKMNICTMSQ